MRWLDNHVAIMPTSRYTVVYEAESRQRYKLCRLLLTTDGSYHVTVPYHVSERVSLSKRKLNYPNLPAVADEPDLELAVLEDDEHRLKLSHHPDGFVQFSGEGILSGGNPDGTPKGLGIRSFPLSMPTAGPACGVSIMDATQFSPAGPVRAGDIIFRESELFAAPIDNGLIIEFFYLPARWRRFIRMQEGRPVIWIRHPSGAILELAVCIGPGEAWVTGFVGVDAWTVPMRLGDQGSGFTISSPAGSLRYNERDELEGVALFAAYPPLTDESVTRMSLAFPPRDDPPYYRGGVSPSGPDAMARNPPRESGGQSEPDSEQTAPKSEESEMTTPAALYNLGNHLRDEGDAAGAQTAYQQAIDSADTHILPKAAFNLGILLENNDPAAAKAAYKIAIESGHPRNAPRAAVNLGNLLWSEGDGAGAKSAYRRAIGFGDIEQVPMATINLGIALRTEGIREAAEAFESVIASNHPDLSPSAAVLLGNLLSDAHEAERASRAYRLAINSGHPEQAPLACISLGNLLRHQEDNEGAAERYREAMVFGHPECAAHGAYNLGLVLLDAGDCEGAKEAFQTAAASGIENAVVSARAALNELNGAGEPDEQPS